MTTQQIISSLFRLNKRICCLAKSIGNSIFPPGGTIGQILSKASNADGDVEWIDQSGGGGAYIPLSGTVSGSPVTGDINSEAGLYVQGFGSSVGGIRLISTELVGSNPFVSIGDLDAIYGPTSITINTQLQAIDIFGEAITIGASGASRGLMGGRDFTPNITDLDYTQKKYVDDAIANGVNFEYTDNAAAKADGKPDGFIYRTGDLLKIVHS